MASTRLSQLRTKSINAENVLTSIKSKLSLFEDCAIKQYCKKSEELLSIENEKLRVEINNLKLKLVKAEIMNGKKQVELPNKTISKSEKITTSNESIPSKTSKPKEIPVKKAKKDNAKKPVPAVADLEINVSLLDFRVGEIVEVRRHEDADSLYVETVDLGEEQTRTVISGLVKHVPIEQMKRRCVFLCNLKPAKMRGILSQAMVMCASSPDKVEIITPPEGSNIGDRIYVKGFEGTALPVLNPKKKIFEAIKPDLQIKDGIATYKGLPWLIQGNDNLCTVKHVQAAQIS